MTRSTQQSRPRCCAGSEPGAVSGRPAPVHTAATATACTHVYADPTFPGSSHRESSGQAGLSPQKGGGTPTKVRTERQREVRGDLRAQTQREEAQLRAEAQAPTAFLHCGQAHVCGHGHQDLHKGPALLEPAEPIKVGDPVPPPGLGPNHPGEPGRGSPASVGRASLPRRETMRCHLAPWRRESCNGWVGTRCGQKQGPTPALSPGDL